MNCVPVLLYSLFLTEEYSHFAEVEYHTSRHPIIFGVDGFFILSYKSQHRKSGITIGRINHWKCKLSVFIMYSIQTKYNFLTKIIGSFSTDLFDVTTVIWSDNSLKYNFQLWKISLIIFNCCSPYCFVVIGFKNNLSIDTSIRLKLFQEQQDTRYSMVLRRTWKAQRANMLRN